MPIFRGLPFGNPTKKATVSKLIYVGANFAYPNLRAVKLDVANVVHCFANVDVHVNGSPNFEVFPGNFAPAKQMDWNHTWWSVVDGVNDLVSLMTMLNKRWLPRMSR